MRKFYDATFRRLTGNWYQGGLCNPANAEAGDTGTEEFVGDRADCIDQAQEWGYDRAVFPDDEEIYDLRAMEDFGRINSLTGFANGDRFGSTSELRRYFSRENMIDMFGECSLTDEELEDMADTAAYYGWHMAIGADEEETDGE